MSYNKKSNLYDGYIYCIENNIDNMKYIGQTTISVHMRWLQHKSDAKNINDDSYYLHNAMSKYGIRNFSIKEIEKVSCSTKEDLLDQLNEKEIYYISLYNTLRPNGYNLTLGGNNCSERFKRQIDAYNANGEIILSFNSLVEAMDYFNLSNSHSLRKCCNGLLDSAYGFIWRYHDDNFSSYPINVTQDDLDKDYNHFVPVDIYSLFGELLYQFDSISDALRYFGKTKNHSFISACLNGYFKQADGYVWRRRGEPFNKYPIDASLRTCVDVYDYSKLEFVKSYLSITDALKDLGLSEDIHSACVLVCQGRQKSIKKKYIFRYHGDSLYKYGDPKARNKKITKKIHKYTTSAKFVSQIKSALSEAHELHCSPNAIQDCCKNKMPNQSHEYKGFLWYYADDPNQPDKTKIIAA